jgi:hypothetical protein
VVVYLSAVLSIAIAALICVAAYAGLWIVVAAGGLCVLVLGIGWPRALALPHPAGSTALITATGGAALVVAATTAPTAISAAQPLSALAAVVAIALLTSFLHELLRRDGRPDVVESITGTLTGQVIAVLAAGWVLLVQVPEGPQSVVVGAAAIAVSRVVRALPLPEMITIWAAIAAGGVAGAVAAVALNAQTPVKSLIAGACVSGVGVAVDHLLDARAQLPALPEDHDPGEAYSDGPGYAPGPLAMLAVAAAPVAAAGTVAYAVLQFSPG